MTQKIYTKTGDGGETGLFGGGRVSKASVRVEAYGEVDELNAVIGWARAGGRRALPGFSLPSRSDPAPPTPLGKKGRHQVEWPPAPMAPGSTGASAGRRHGAPPHTPVPRGVVGVSVRVVLLLQVYGERRPFGPAARSIAIENDYRRLEIDSATSTIGSRRSIERIALSYGPD
jgi:hypothetical protein